MSAGGIRTITHPMPDDVGSISGEWLYEAARASQRIMCDIRSGAHDSQRAVDAIADLPEPRTRLEQLVFQGLCFDIVLGCVDQGAASSRKALTRDVLQRILKTSTRPSALRDSPARRAIDWIRRHFAQPLEVTAIARKIGCDASALRRLVRQEFGLSMRQLHIRIRVLEALKMFVAGNRKISAVARAVGYRSEKNFYRAMRGVTGWTPSKLSLMNPRVLETVAAGILPRKAGITLAV